MKIIDKLVGIISIIAMAGLLGAYAAPYINPNSFVFFSLLGLAYPYLLLSNMVLLLYWVTRWKKMALIQFIVILLGIPFFMSYYGTNNTKGSNQPYDYSILSYNVRFFDKYGWSKDKKTKQKLIEYLNRFEGDICCLQEFPTSNYTIKPLDIVNSLPTYPYHFIVKDMALFSRLPIIRTGQIIFAKKHTSASIFCDVVKGKDTVRVYNIHLESYKLGNKERKFVKEITQGTGSNITDGIKGIASRLVTANKNRAEQAEQIQQHISKSPYKIILCGDFNDTPLSYTYKKLNSELNDSFIEKGRGLGNTYIGEFPSFRIDYILHSAEFETISYSRGNTTLSDHYPIRSKLKTKKSKV